MSASPTPCLSLVRQWASPSLKHLGASPNTSSPLLAYHDDELERRQRRKSKVIDLHNDSFTESACHSTTGTPAAVPKLSNAQISEHYSTCIKLSTENKITTKNAFGLHLIDYMADILKQKDSETTNFKVAAGTLDASTKIYAVRVDAVHADAYRVLGGLGGETKPGEGDGGGGEEGSSEEELAVKQVVKKKRPPKKTVEQNLSNINSPETERRCEVDPMFQRMASSFDESSTAGVFLSVLFSEDRRCELLFPSHMTLLHSRPPCAPPPPQATSAQPFTGSLQRCQEERLSICPSLQDFSFTSWNPDQTTSQLLEKMKQGEHVFDVNAEAESGEDECGGQDFGDDFDVDYEEGGHGDACEGTSQQKDRCASARTQGGGDVIPIGEGDVTTMCLQLSTEPREYSYFSPKTMATWAGPDYWQFKPKHKQENVSDKEPHKRKPKKAFEIDFNSDIAFETLFCSTKAATTTSKSALSTSNKRTTLPADFKFSPESLSQLTLKPSSTLLKYNKRLSGELGEDIKDYDYNNANDTANFCPGLQGDSDDEGEGLGSPDDIEPSAESLPVSSQDHEIVSTYGEADLVPEPQRVNKIQINYAKTAKKMDMKRLKDSMWTLLTDAPEKQAKQEADDAETSEVPGEKVFSQTTKSLLQSLPSNMAQNLSVPLAFVALLHLANEKNLKLVGVEDMSDIVIKQGH